MDHPFQVCRQQCSAGKLCLVLGQVQSWNPFNYINPLHDSSSMCGKEETTNHMILCEHTSWLKLCCRYITTLRARLTIVKTNAGLLDTFCSAISDWFDYGAVYSGKYPEHYHQAISQQTNIDWCHVFLGHLVTPWSVLQIPEDPRDQDIVLFERVGVRFQVC